MMPLKICVISPHGVFPETASVFSQWRNCYRSGPQIKASYPVVLSIQGSFGNSPSLPVQSPPPSQEEAQSCKIGSS